MRLLWASSAIVASTVLASDPANLTKAEWNANQKAIQDNITADENRNKKMAAVDKAITMLESLRSKVFEEGEEEAALYNKFACFCKDTTEDRLASIKTGEDQQTELTTDIGTLTNKRDTLDTKISTTMTAIAGLETDIKNAKTSRKSTFEVYSKNTVDLASALESLKGAIQTLKASKSPSLVQLRSVSETVRTAALLADALGLGGKATERASTLFLQAPANEVAMEDYKYHSDDIISTLEGLQKDFITEKNTVDAAEVESVKAHDLLLQEKTNSLKLKNHELDQARKDKSKTVADVVSASQELSTVEATLREDKDYTSTLQQMCSDKAKTWNQRSQARANELSTLTDAIGIVRGAVKGNTSANTVRFAQKHVSVRFAKVVAVDAGSMDAIEAEAEQAEQPPALVQVTQRRGMLRATVNKHPESADGRSMVMQLLSSQGKQLQSTLLSALASKIASDPFAKVKQLIQELIERLLQEASNEANQKGWCDKATADAKQKRDFAAEEIASLNSEMAKLQADADRLSEEIGILRTDITELTDARSTATADRAAEKTQNEATVDEAEEGLTAIDMCIDLLDKFYRTLKKDTVNLTLAQGPFDDAPDSGFEGGEAYTGAQSGAGGILAMLDVMKSDFVRTVTETEKAEAESEADHLQFMTETGKALAQKTEARGQKNDQKGDAETKYGEAQNRFYDQSDCLNGALRELMDLKPVCITTGMSYADRVSRREDEIAALNRAMCILGKYEQYGPDGAKDC